MSVFKRKAQKLAASFVVVNAALLTTDVIAVESTPYPGPNPFAINTPDGDEDHSSIEKLHLAVNPIGFKDRF